MDKNMDGKLSLEEFIEVDIYIFYIYINLFTPGSDLFEGYFLSAKKAYL